jgi:hypothetical protein
MRLVWAECSTKIGTYARVLHVHTGYQLLVAEWVNYPDTLSSEPFRVHDPSPFLEPNLDNRLVK